MKLCWCNFSICWTSLDFVARERLCSRIVFSCPFRQVKTFSDKVEMGVLNPDSGMWKPVRDNDCDGPDKKVNKANNLHRYMQRNKKFMLCQLCVQSFSYQIR